MTPAKKEFVIQEGDELKLECQGEGKLYFSTPTKAENVHILISLYPCMRTVVDKLMVTIERSCTYCL